jgi:hypothetical protein
MSTGGRSDESARPGGPRLVPWRESLPGVPVSERGCLRGLLYAVLVLCVLAWLELAFKWPEPNRPPDPDGRRPEPSVASLLTRAVPVVTAVIALAGLAASARRELVP